MVRTPRTVSRVGLGVRLLTAFTLVVVVGGLTAWAVASLVGPKFFQRHMRALGSSEDPEAVIHAEQAFRSASTLTLMVALAVAALASLALSYVLTNRIRQSLSALASVANHLTDGKYSTRAESPHVGVEFDQLAIALNDMASRLERGEELRRRLLTDVAHELRTPLATLTAYLEAMDDGVTPTSPEVIGVLRGQVSRLTRLADDLAATTKAENRSLPMNLEVESSQNLVVTAALAVRQLFSRKHVNLEIVTNADAPTVLVDKDRIGQVLGNLLDNALRHTPEGGTVAIRAERGIAGTAVLRVDDTGEGIGPDHLPFVFDRFYRADTARDREHGGAGIGLSIARALVEAHGGTIGAESEGIGRGASMVITLPATPAPMKKRAPTRSRKPVT